ncbi:MAG: hypothetical protein NTX08_08545 [Sphingobacteriales bacterium]|nr:hypothetical protein [Sphingobacteriales bacterium]
MSLDNIQLTPILWQNLYKHALIQEKKIQASDPIANANTIPFLGNNKKMITLLVHDEEAIYLSDASLKFLLGILSACKLSMDDIALVNLSKNNGITHDLIHTQLQSEKILMFDVEPSELLLPLQFPRYQIQGFNNQTYLAAPALTTLEQDKAEKLKLWNCLKQLFGI